MSLLFEELDWRPTSIGTLSLRRRKDLVSGVDIYEIKLGEEFLMSSLFTVAEIALARLALAATSVDALDVVVGGLGLGYTANAVLEDDRVRSLAVVEALPTIVDWHRQRLLPLGAQLTDDPRCRFVEGDFFALLRSPDEPLDPENAGRLLHAIVVDIDHSPRRLLSPRNADFYSPAGLRQLAARLHPGGVFALWSDDPPDEEFLTAQREVFTSVAAHVIRFDNPLRDHEASNTVYVATTDID
jgi:spermidine synthase